MNLICAQVYNEEDRVTFFSAAAGTAFLKARVAIAACQIPITLTSSDVQGNWCVLGIEKQVEPLHRN